MLIIAVSSIAAALDQKSVVVNATVAPYAVITVTAEKIAFSPFSGAAGEVRTTRSIRSLKIVRIILWVISTKMLTMIQKVI